ncbi:hypothetical protein [Lewinella sp. IMCC34183]|uniref:hypothetical protein n=1 Tax=Lewinella sp. IMCC34183 TaxID=2248762 RepID=UPI000E22836B|nr:hypothetical protein [Lewinella sp. IMCC34183]
MKLIYLLLILCAFAIDLSGQSAYKSGYLVNASGQRESVRILDRDWVDNPLQFRYLTADDQRLRGTVAAVREFGYDDGSLRYLRAVAPIDRSSNRVGELSSSSQPEYKNDTVFLEWLVDGAADLFYYEDGELRRFFYRLGDGVPRPLVNRRYRRGQAVLEQAPFRGELRRQVNCGGADADVRDLGYRRRELVAYFEEYNACEGVAYQTMVRQPAADWLRISLRPGGSFHFGEVRFDGSFGGRRIPELVPTTGVRLGVEAEAVLPLANQQWSVFGELYVQRVTSGRDSITRGDASLNLRSLNVPLGFRRYIHLGPQRSLFVSLFGLFQFPWDSYTFVTNARVKGGYPASWNFGLGAGGGYRSGRWLVELRYAHNQDILQKFVNVSTYYRSVSLVAGYRLLPW